jgi:two-component system, OmpR family, response regulator
MTATAEKPRVLVVDDNKDAATTLAILLESAGYEVHTCFDGQTALKEADQFAPDACVLDINMPGMDGYELARRIRAKDPEHAPVLATVTAYEDYGHLTKAADVGFDLHFTKPANPAEVAEQIADEVKRHAERHGIRHPERHAQLIVSEIDADHEPGGRNELSPTARDARAGRWMLPTGVAIATLVGLGIILGLVVAGR